MVAGVSRDCEGIGKTDVPEGIIPNNSMMHRSERIRVERIIIMNGKSIKSMKGSCTKIILKDY